MMPSSTNKHRSCFFDLCSNITTWNRHYAHGIDLLITNTGSLITNMYTDYSRGLKLREFLEVSPVINCYTLILNRLTLNQSDTLVSIENTSLLNTV